MERDKIMSKEERREPGHSLSETIKMLNAVQSHTLGEYMRTGANLAFVRDTEQGPLAVCKTHEGLVTIDENGMIDRHPNIQIRE